ncbi:MAG TPA: hypothetical protein VKR62_12125 [Roseiarcus sp.]|nr:hypothetical protein [Roseiarcus sp.]
MLQLNARRKTLLILGIAFLAAVAAALLPDDPYQRWQLLDGTIQKNARWIYERTNFDPTPIDVAVLGPSRSAADVDSRKLEAALTELGTPAHVVNFSLPEAGRDINYAAARELFKTKSPKVLVLGVTEKPSRFGHPAFKYVAPSWLVADPGYFINLNYLSNLIYLPYRQMELFLADLWPPLMGLTKTFDPATYRGSNIDTTGAQFFPNSSGSVPASHAELMRGVHKLEKGMRPPILPASLRDVEFGDERHYIREIAELARARGTRLVFLNLPFYSDSDTIQEEPFYQEFGDVIDAAFLASHPEWYADYGHLTAHGAGILTAWLAPTISKELGKAK